MFNIKYDKTLNSIYEEIQKTIEPSIEDIVKDVSKDPKAYIQSILDSQNLNEILTKYLEETDKENPDLGILATALSQIINKEKE